MNEIHEEDVDETTRLMSGEVSYDNDTSSRDRRPRRHRGDQNTDAVSVLKEYESSSML